VPRVAARIDALKSKAARIAWSMMTLAQRAMSDGVGTDFASAGDHSSAREL
jgi:hypothetical protein